MIPNLWWIWDNLYFLYKLHFTKSNYDFAPPDLVSYLSIFFGIAGVIIGFRIIRSSLKIKKGILLQSIIIALQIILVQIGGFFI